MRRTRLGRVGAVVALAILAAACSSSPAATHTTTGSTGIPAPPTGGHASPSEAATGFIVAVLSTHRANACDYVVPSQLSSCEPAIAAIHVTADRYSLGDTSTDGDQALVVLLATNLCIEAVILHGKSCHSNTDPERGLPASKASFAAAYRASLDSTKTGLSTIPCQLVAGKWYVEL